MSDLLQELIDAGDDLASLAETIAEDERANSWKEAARKVNNMVLIDQAELNLMRKGLEEYAVELRNLDQALLRVKVERKLFNRMKKFFVNQVEDYVKQLRDVGGNIDMVDSDLEYYIFEGAIQAWFGEDVWPLINAGRFDEVLERVSDVGNMEE